MFPQKKDDLNKALSVAEDFLQEQAARRGERKSIRKNAAKKAGETQIGRAYCECCPKCGGIIGASVLYQYSQDYIIGRFGKALRNFTTNNYGAIITSIASCTNPSCDVRWEADEFKIDEDGYFVDFKYTESERDL